VSLAKILSIYNKLPEAEKNMVAVVVDGVAYTWNQVVAIVRQGGPLAERIQRMIEELYHTSPIRPEQWELVLARLYQMPENLALVIRGKTYGKWDLIREVQRRSEIGEIVARMILEYLGYITR